MVRRVAVLGGGLQGACVAMELASSGIKVDLYDKNQRCLTQASAQNEGKIHLGYVYANDRSLRTARTMVRGAIAFAPLLRRWLGSEIDTVPVSTPFRYAVHAQSLLSAEEIENHLLATHAIALEESGAGAPDYFGSDYRIEPQRLSAAARDALYDCREVTAAFETAEVGIDPEALAQVVRARLASDSSIRCFLGAQVRAVTPDRRRPTVHFEIAGAPGAERYDHVVNTLWDGRLAVDRTAGLEPERPWLYRVKHYLRVHAPALRSPVPSTTIVLGAFGDVASYAGGDLYLSWYPAGMVGTSSALSPPPWPLELDDVASRDMRGSILAGLGCIVPGVAALANGAIESCRVRTGIVFAWGRTDIYDRASGLHERYAIGPVSRGRYHSIDTGKLTMAPLWGKTIAQRIRQAG